MGYPVVHSRWSGRTERRSSATTPSSSTGSRLRERHELRHGHPRGEPGARRDGIGGGITGGPDGYEGHVTFYVAVPDIEASLQKAESLGGTRIFGPETIMEGLELGQFKDPEGHVIGLVKPSM